MPSWRKIIVSGSDAQLNSLYVTNAVTASVFSGSFSGSLFGTASWAYSSSQALTASYGNITGSLFGTSSWAYSSSQALTASYGDITGSLFGTASWAYSSSQALTASYGNITGSLFGTSSWSINALTASYGNITGSLFGTASWAQSASQALTASYGNITGSLFGTASWAYSASQAVSASYITGSIFGSGNLALSASYALSSSYSVSSSYSLSSSYAVSSSYALSSSFATSASYALSSSFSTSSSYALSSSYSVSASYALSSSYSVSSSYAVSSSYSLSSSFATTSSYTATASYVNPLKQTVEITGSLYTTGSNIFIGTQTVTGSLFTTGSNTLVGNTILSGTLQVQGEYPPEAGSASVSIVGNVDLNGFLRFDPVTSNIDTTISASYIYVSGSTNDLYFSQNGAGYANVTRLRWLEGNLYTGLLDGGIVTQVNSNTYQISSGSGIVVDLNVSYNDNPYPVVEYLNWGNLTNTIDALSGSFDQQFVAISSSAGTAVIKAQGTPYVDGDYNDFIPIGIVLHQNRSTINGVQTFPGVAYGWKQRSFDFIKAFGALKISGYTLAQSGSSTRGLLLSGGTSWVDGRNYVVDPNQPSYIVEAVGTTTSKIFRYYQSGSNWQSNWGYNTNGGAGFTDIDPTQYSNAGTLTSVGSNKWTIQRVFYFPNSATKALFVYYGNTEYANEAAALAAVDTEPFTEAPNTAASSIYVGYMILRNDADFTVPASYEFYAGGLFRGSGTGGGGGTTTLSALTDVLITSPTYGDLLMYDTTVWNNTKTLSGSYTLSGSLVLSNGNYITGSLLGTASYAQTASYLLGSIASAAQIETTATDANGTYYVTLVGTSPVSATPQTVYTDTTSLTYNPSTNALTVDSVIATSFTGSLRGTASYVTGSVFGSGNPALSSSYALSASTAVSVQNIKSGVVSTFGGNPKTGSVTFTPAYANASYAVTVTGGTGNARSWTVESKTSSGFVINSNSNTAISGEVNWIAVPYNT